MITQVSSHTACPWSSAIFHNSLFILVALLSRPSGGFSQVADRGGLDNLGKNEVISRQGRDQMEGLLSSSQAPFLVTMSLCFLKACLGVSQCCLLAAVPTLHLPLFTIVLGFPLL